MLQKVGVHLKETQLAKNLLRLFTRFVLIRFRLRNVGRHHFHYSEVIHRVYFYQLFPSFFYFQLAAQSTTHLIETTIFELWSLILLGVFIIALITSRSSTFSSMYIRKYFDYVHWEVEISLCVSFINANFGIIVDVVYEVFIKRISVRVILLHYSTRLCRYFFISYTS